MEGATVTIKHHCWSYSGECDFPRTFNPVYKSQSKRRLGRLKLHRHPDDAWQAAQMSGRFRVPAETRHGAPQFEGLGELEAGSFRSLRNLRISQNLPLCISKKGGLTSDRIVTQTTKSAVG